MAYASAWADLDSDSRLRVGAARGRARRRDTAGRHRVVRTGREALAWRDADDRDDAHRHSGKKRRQSCGMDGKSQRRPVPEVRLTGIELNWRKVQMRQSGGWRSEEGASRAGCELECRQEIFCASW